MPRVDRSDRGFTLLEMLVTLSIAGIMAGIAGMSMARYASNAAHRGTRDEVVSLLRTTAEQALSEGRTYCVSFSTTGWTTYRYACSGPTAVQVGSANSPSSADEQLTPSFTPTTGLVTDCPGALSSCAYFYPRGNASAGTVTVTRAGKSDYVVEVKGLTSRVFAQ